MDELITPGAVTVRELLAHFRATLAHARETGAPVIIALRHNRPVGVLLDHATWQEHVQAQAAEQRPRRRAGRPTRGGPGAGGRTERHAGRERQPRGWQTAAPQERATGWQPAPPAATGWGRPAGG